MDIRKRLTYQFTLFTGVFLFIAMLAIYMVFSGFRKEEFRQRLERKAELVAMIYAHSDTLDPGILGRMERSSPTSLPLETVAIFNSESHLVYISRPEMDTLYNPALVNAAFEKKKASFRTGTYDSFGYVYPGNGSEQLLVFCSGIDVFGRHKLKVLGILLILVFLTGLCVIYFSGRVFAARAIVPVSRFMEQLSRIDINHMSARMQASRGSDEIAQFGATINQMLDRLEDGFQEQKNFISNSSHELRNPLTAITGQLEVTLMQERSTTEYKQVLHSVLEDIKSLNTLTNRLLLLSRAAGNLPADGMTKIRVDELVWKSVAEVSKRYPRRNINIRFEDSIEGEHHFFVLGNEQLLVIAFNNIIDNSCKYGGEEAVEISLKAVDDFIEILFSDHGIGIPGEEQEMVFQPFYRAANVSGTRGQGIGLSIVKKIITLHQGSVSFRSSTGHGTDFRVALPLCS